MRSELNVIQAPEPVLSTLNVDGTRRWLRPKPSPGRMRTGRRITAWTLIAIFCALPYVRIHGRPAILLDLPHREFTLFGTTFQPGETLLFMLLLVSLFIGVFLVTALFGRVWCGWACPQTVYMEFLFRPLEYWIEGGPRGTTALDRHGLSPRRILKYAVFAVLAAFLAHIFLAYFVSIDVLAQWVRRSPIEHPTTFAIMLGTTALIFLDFTWFREQTCLVACPYGRIQSVLLDRRSRIVGYEKRRGEPRRKGTHDRPADAGDCIDCGLCVLTCPTGIDIRDGLQMECIHCTQCVDACDAVMDRIGKPRGLIRYTTQDRIDGRPSPRLRPRVVLYPLALAVTFGLFLWQIATRTDAEVTLLRGIGAPFTVESDGSVVNQVRIRVANRADHARSFHIDLEGAPEAKLIAPINPLPVSSGALQTTSVFVVLPKAAFQGGERPVRFRVSEGRFDQAYDFPLLGPQAGAAADPGAEKP
jgi:cytochrome c oxidase accessory protein FixG